MPAGNNALGAGAGFARGFATSLLGAQERVRAEKRASDEKRLKEFGVIFPLIYKEAEESGDFTRANEIIGEYMPDVGKRMKKEGADLSLLRPQGPAPTAGTELQRPTPGAVAGARSAFAPAATAQMEAGGPPVLESRPAVSPGTPAPPPPPVDPKSQFLGQTMTTPTQRIESKTRAARRFAQANPDVPLMAAFEMFGLEVPNAASAASQGSLISVAGETADGKTTFGVHDRRPASPTFGKYLDPDTMEPIENFTPRTSTGSTSLGTLTERAAKTLGYASATAAARAGAMEQVNAKAAELRESDARASGTGSGQAKITTELQMPIGPTAAALYNVPPTTTLAELQSRVTLRPEQQQKVANFAQVDQLLTEITDLLPIVFPNVDETIQGRLQSQLSLGMQQLMGGANLAQLDAAINASIGQIARLSGEVGNLSKSDLDQARATLAQLKPSLFGGDTLKTAQARLGVVQRLLAKAKAGVPGGTATPGGVAPAPGAAPAAAPAAAPGAAPGAGTPPSTGAVIRDGNVYIDGVLIGPP